LILANQNLVSAAVLKEKGSNRICNGSNLWCQV